MSADNGIYILKTKDSYRVTHEQAIENLFYCHLDPYGSGSEVVPTRAIEIFSGCKYTRNEEVALKIAHSMEQNTYTEYGVRMFTTHKSWQQIIREAKSLAAKEIDCLKKQNENNSWTYQIANLQRIIDNY